MSDDQQVEQQIQAKGLTAPRVTPQSLDAKIVGEDYHVFPGTTVTVCLLHLENGFTVTGESACASPENFDAEMGRQIARRNAREKVWSLEGYLLRQRLHEAASKPEEIARLCHEVNRAYCKALGDDSQPAWEDAPDWQQASARLGVELHLGNPDAGPQASHESWMAQKEVDGWVYGDVKDPEAKTHPCMVAFAELPVEQQAKDYLFKAVVNAMAVPSRLLGS